MNFIFAIYILSFIFLNPYPVDTLTFLYAITGMDSLLDQLSKIARMERKGETVTIRTYLDEVEEKIAKAEDATAEANLRADKAQQESAKLRQEVAAANQRAEVFMNLLKANGITIPTVF